MPISQAQAEDIGKRYTAAWCAHDPDGVASFYTADGRIIINDGDPSDGRAAVAGSLRAVAAEGVAHAFLFTDADNVAAQRAYEALGFERIGAYGLVRFTDPQAVAPR